MAIWDHLRTAQHRPAAPEQSTAGECQKPSITDMFWQGVRRSQAMRAAAAQTERVRQMNQPPTFDGLALIPVVLELDTAGNVLVRCNSLQATIYPFVAQHRALLAEVLRTMPRRRWDSMTDSVGDLTSRAQVISLQTAS